MNNDFGISGRNLMEFKLQFLVWSHGGSVHALIGLLKFYVWSEMELQCSCASRPAQIELLD